MQDLQVAQALETPVVIKRGRGRPRKHAIRPVETIRFYGCRAVYQGLKCQLKGKHKGVHFHMTAQAGAVISVSWHPMVSGNVVPKNGKSKLGTLLTRLEAEINPGLAMLE